MALFGRRKSDVSEIDRLTNRLNALVTKLDEPTVNTGGLASRSLRDRVASAISGGYDFSDTMHNVYVDYGYPQSLRFDQLWNMWRRLGIAKAGVELPISVCWMTLPRIEGSDRVAAMVKALDERHKLWTRLRALDLRQRVGRYAGLFMRVADGQTPDKPIEGTPALMSMTPLFEGELRVIQTVSDPASPDYGQPSMYQFQSGRNTGDRNERAQSSFSLHPSRVVIAAEGADDGSIYGIPALEACFNSLMDLRKIIGGGGEGFYKTASQPLVFDVNDARAAFQNLDKLEDFRERIDDFMQNRARRALMTPGMTPRTLESNLRESQTFFDAALSDVAASLQIPATILIGKQTGRLASDQDAKHFLSVCNSRRETFVTPMIKDVLDWMMQYGVLPREDCEIVWDDLLEQSDADRLANALKMTEVNERNFRSGGAQVFDENEVREQAGYEDLDDDDEMIGEDAQD